MKKQIFEQAVANLKPGKEYSVVFENDWGFCSSFSCKLVSAEFKQYAQYHENIDLIVKLPRKKLARKYHLHEGKSFAIFEGKVFLDTDIWSKAKNVSEGLIQARYTSCDERWFSDAIQGAKDQGAVAIIENKGR